MSDPGPPRPVSALPVQIRCLGVAPGHPTPGSGFSAFLVESGEDRLLLDAGEPVAVELKQQGIAFRTIRAVLISHMHVDHVAGIFMLIQSAWLTKRREPLTVYLPEHAVPSFPGFLKQMLLPPELLPFELHVFPIKRHVTLEIGPFYVEPVPTSHLDRLKERYPTAFAPETEAYGFRVRVGGHTIGYSGDIGAVADLKAVVGDGVDVLLCELAHCEPEALFEQLARLPVRKVVFVHIAEQFAAQINSLLLEAEKLLGPNRVTVAKAFDQLSVV